VNSVLGRDYRHLSDEELVELVQQRRVDVVLCWRKQDDCPAATHSWQ